MLSFFESFIYRYFRNVGHGNSASDIVSNCGSRVLTWQISKWDAITLIHAKLENNFIPKVGQKLAVTIFIYLWFMACEKLVNVSSNYIYLWFMACEKLVNVSSNYFVICSGS